MKQTKQQILRAIDKNENGFLSVEEVNFFMNKVCKENWFLLEQETIYFLLHEYGIQLNDGDYSIFLNKMNALKTFLSVDSFYHDIDIFQKIVLAFNEKIVDMEVFQDIDVSDVIFCFYQLQSFIDFTPDTFSDEVESYIASIAKDEGFIVLPEIISFCQTKLDILNSNCGFLSILKKAVYGNDKNIDELDLDNVVDNQVYKIKYAELIASSRDVNGGF